MGEERNEIESEVEKKEQRKRIFRYTIHFFFYSNNYSFVVGMKCFF